MEIVQKVSEKKYPYLAVLSACDISKNGKPERLDDLVLISKVNDSGEEKIHVQYVNGNSKAYFTRREEEEYIQLHTGYEITLTQ